MAGVIRPARRPPGWSPGGPLPRGPRGRLDLEPADDEDLSYLAGEWRLFQKRQGHRWSLDDLVTADLAARLGATARTALDLGCGQGSVLLLLAWRFPSLVLTGIEAQPDRAALARRSISYNGVEDRCTVLDGDLRQPVTGQFELVTGTPPYFPLSTGSHSTRPHAVPCRFEVRGGVEAYLEAAGRVLDPSGVFVMCFSAPEQDRVDAAAGHAGLHADHHLDVIPREGKAPLVAVEAFRPGGAVRTPARDVLTVRLSDGQWSEDFLGVRARFGMPPRPPSV